MTLGDNKLLIFSEFTDTLDYLEKHLNEPLSRIDGNMKQQERDNAVREFRNTNHIMIASDAAREGLNMQFCHMMVNYDLPWSPIVLEQRMGRLHRYGQENDVMIYNMIADDTVEGYVLGPTLRQDEKEIEKQYSAVDIIGTILSGVNMRDIMVESISGRTAASIDGQVQHAKVELEWAQKTLEHTPVDLGRALKTKEEIAEKHVDGEYLERMMRVIFGGLDGKIKSTRQKDHHTGTKGIAGRAAQAQTRIICRTD